MWLNDNYGDYKTYEIEMLKYIKRTRGNTKAKECNFFFMYIFKILLKCFFFVI